jgi:hypothetical protein
MTVGEHWHVRREFTVGTLLTILVYGVVLIMTIVSLGGRVEKLEESTVDRERMAIAETRIASAERNAEALEQRTIKALDDIRDILRRIEEDVKRPR